ncbi:hypothetical protein NQ318_020822, partial [Aromia moschata]
GAVSAFGIILVVVLLTGAVLGLVTCLLSHQWGTGGASGAGTPATHPHHAADSPTTAPCWLLVRKLGLLDMVTLKGTRFESVEAVKAKATEVPNQLTEADFQHCFQQWKSRMERCRDSLGRVSAIGPLSRRGSDGPGKVVRHELKAAARSKHQRSRGHKLIVIMCLSNGLAAVDYLQCTENRMVFLVSDILGMKRVAAGLVPKELNVLQKEHRKQVTVDMVSRADSEPNIMKRFTTGDETWVFEYDMQTSRQSSE